MTAPPDDTVMLIPNQGWDARIHICRCGTTVDSFIITSQRYIILVDTLINPNTARTLLTYASEHLSGPRRLLVINTHADWDHCWGNQLFDGPTAVHPAPIIAHRRCAERLRMPDATATLAKMRASEPTRFVDVQLTPPTILFDEHLTIECGDLTLKLLPTPGHQPDHIAIFIPEIATLLAGDAAESPFPLVDTPGGLPLLRESLARMAALAPAVALYCHAPVNSGPQLLHDNIAYFNALESYCTAALQRGNPAHPSPDDDVEHLIGWPFATAVPAGVDTAMHTFYQRGHQEAIRAMLAAIQEGPSEYAT